MTEKKPKPWEDKNGATDVDGFLEAYADDENAFWRAEQGHIKNVLDELIERLDQLHAERGPRLGRANEPS